MLPLHAALEQLHTGIVAALPDAAADVLLKTHPRLTAAQRIGIYKEAYHLRLRAAVRADYPATLHYLGAAHADIIADFVRQTPSDNYNLDRYSISFADYVARHAAPPVAALAALESALTEAFMFQDVPALPASALAGMDEAALGTTRFTLQQSVRLLHLTNDVEDYFTAFKASAAPTEIAARVTWLLLYRQNRDVQRLKISAGEFASLQAIKAGADFDTALAAAMAAAGGEAAILPHIGRWLAGWFERGMIATTE